MRFRRHRQRGLWVAVGTVVASVLSILFQTTLSLFLSEDDFGAFSAATIAAIALGIVIALGCQNVLLDAVKSAGLAGRPLLRTYLRIWAAVVGVLLFAGVIVAVLAPAAGPTFAYIASLAVMVAASTILGSERQGEDDFIGVACYLVAPELVKCLAILVSWIAGARTLEMVYLVCFFTFGASTLVVLSSPIIWRKMAEPTDWRRLLVLGAPHALSGLVFMGYYRASVVVLSVMGLLADAGSLAVIYLFVSGLLLLPTTYSQRFLLGRWHSLARELPHRFRRELRRQTTGIVLFTLPIAAGWFILAPIVLAWIYGDRYEGAQTWAPWFAIVLALRAASIPIQSAASIAPLRWGKAAVISVAAVSVITVTFVLGGSLGIASGFIAGIVAEVVLIVGLLLIIHRYWMRRSSQV